MEPPDPNRHHSLERELAELQREVLLLRKAQEHHRLFADSIEDYAFITFDLDNRITGWNRGAEKLLGYSEEEALGQSGSIVFTPEDRAAGAVERELTTAIREGRAEDERWH